MTRQLILLMLLILVSCNSKTNKKNEAHSDENREINSLELQTNIPFSGIYVNEEYLKALIKTKSPRSAQEKCVECMIIIPNKTLERATMIYNFHEGGGDLTIVKNEGKFQLWEMAENKPEHHNSDITPLKDNAIRVFDKTFVKIQDIKTSSPEMQEPLIIEQYLFNGIYSDGLGNNIELDKNGKVKGFNNYKNYYPRIDYYDICLDIDQIGFGATQDNYDWYGFKFNGDTLSLYEIICIDYNTDINDCEAVGYGKLKYKFWRK